VSDHFRLQPEIYFISDATTNKKRKINSICFQLTAFEGLLAVIKDTVAMRPTTPNAPTKRRNDGPLDAGAEALVGIVSSKGAGACVISIFVSSEKQEQVTC